MRKLLLKRTLLSIFAMFPFMIGASNLGGGGCGHLITETFTVGGTLSGVSGTLVLQNNGGDDLSLSSDGAFTFATALTETDTYDITVLTQPENQICTVSNSSGTIQASDITDITITCTTDTSPSVGTDISFLDTSHNATLFQWGAGSDAETTVDALEYKVVITTDLNDLSSAETADALTGGAIVMDWTAATLQAQADSLDATTPYFVGVLVRDENHNMTLYPPQSTTTLSGKRIFLTASAPVSGGNLGGVSGADALCSSDDSTPALGSYKAMLVEGTTRVACTTFNCGGGAGEHTDWVLSANSAYVQPDDTPIGTTNSNGIFTFPLDNAIAPSGSPELWTGLSTDWITFGLDCNGWTSSNGGDIGGVGLGTAINDTSLFIYFQNCDRVDSQRLVCVEQ